MLASSLASALNAEVDNETTEAAAIEAWANAYATYAGGALSNGISVNTGTIASSAKPAMQAAMTGLSTSGIDAIISSIGAFWAAISATPSAYFTGALAVSPPPALASAASLLTSVAASNVTANASKSDALQSFANTLHTASAGATATFPVVGATVIT